MSLGLQGKKASVQDQQYSIGSTVSADLNYSLYLHSQRFTWACSISPSLVRIFSSVSIPVAMYQPPPPIRSLVPQFKIVLAVSG